MKHTPGKWSVHHIDGDRFRIVDSKDMDILSHIATVHFHDDEEGETKANAKLIAAAPVMLDRLTLIENLATQVCDAINKRDAIAYEETLSSIKMLAREAIVEATDKGYHSFNQRGNSV